MGSLVRAFQPQALITTPEELRQELATYSGYGTSGSGQLVTPATAMRVSAVYACVQVISQTVGQLPLVLYRRTAKGKEKAVNHPLYHLVGSKPNGFNNSMSFREMLTAHNCLRGNSFAFINRVGNGRVYELLPLHSDTVGVYRDPWTWEVTYQINQRKGINGIYGPRDVFHLMGMTLNGYQGVTPLTYARETIGLSMATEQHGSRLFKNGARPAGVLTHPKKLSDPAFDRLKEDLENNFSGENAHKAMLLEDGMTWAPVTMTSDDAQFLETRQFQIPEIARFWRMPLHKIQDMSASTNNNIEQQALEFLTDCMMPWFVRWEQSLNTQLLTVDEQKEYFFKFDVDDILRADMKSRFEAYASAVTSRIFNPNECREKEDMDPYEGGDEYANPAITPGQGGQDAKKTVV
jgi:HK97 family phage portal protein